MDRQHLWRLVKSKVLILLAASSAVAQNEAALFNNVRAATHSVWMNPKFVDAEIDGGFRVRNLVDNYGFLSVVPRSRGLGGSHYGEFRSAIRLLKRGRLTVGPAYEHVALTWIRDYEKLGIAGSFGLHRATFTYEAYVWSSVRKRNNVGVSWNIPLPAKWRVTGFADHLVFMPSRPRVVKAALRRPLPLKFEFVIEYFHYDLARPAERNKISAGFGYKLN